MATSFRCTACDANLAEDEDHAEGCGNALYCVGCGAQFSDDVSLVVHEHNEAVAVVDLPKFIYAPSRHFGVAIEHSIQDPFTGEITVDVKF